MNANLSNSNQEAHKRKRKKKKQKKKKKNSRLNQLTKCILPSLIKRTTKIMYSLHTLPSTLRSQSVNYLISELQQAGHKNINFHHIQVLNHPPSKYIEQEPRAPVNTNKPTTIELSQLGGLRRSTNENGGQLHSERNAAYKSTFPTSTAVPLSKDKQTKAKKKAQNVRFIEPQLIQDMLCPDVVLDHVGKIVIFKLPNHLTDEMLASRQAFEFVVAHSGPGFRLPFWMKICGLSGMATSDVIMRNVQRTGTSMTVGYFGRQSNSPKFKIKSCYTSSTHTTGRIQYLNGKGKAKSWQIGGSIIRGIMAVEEIISYITLNQASSSSEEEQQHSNCIDKFRQFDEEWEHAIRPAPAEVNDDSDTSTTSAAVSVEDSKEVPGEIVWIVACSLVLFLYLFINFFYIFFLIFFNCCICLLFVGFIFFCNTSLIMENTTSYKSCSILRGHGISCFGSSSIFGCHAGVVETIWTSVGLPVPRQRNANMSGTTCASDR